MGHLQKLIAALLIGGILLVSGCTRGPETTSAETTQAGKSQAEDALGEARQHYQELVNVIEQAYSPFYELYASESRDIAAMQHAAGGVAEGMRTFTTGLRSYDWPAPVEQTTVDAIVASYGADAVAWDGVATASTLEEMKSKLSLMDPSVAEADELTGDLRTQLGLATSGTATRSQL